MGLVFDQLQFGFRNAFGEDFGLCDVIAADDVAIADRHQRGDIYLT